MNSSWIEEAQAEILEMDADEEIFNQFDVILSRVPASHINEINKEGVVFIFKKQNSYFLEWRANENVENGLTEIAISAMEDAGEEWSIINQITYKSAGDSIGMTGPKMKNLRIALSDVKQFKLKNHELLLYNRADQHIVTYNFKRSSAGSLLRVLTNLRLLTNDRNIYSVKDPEFEKLQKSFAELNIESIKSSKALPRPLFVHGYEFLSQLGSNVLGRKEEKHQDSRPGAYRFDIGMCNETSPESQKIDATTADTEIHLEKAPLPPRKIFKRDKPLSLKQWQEFIFEDGRISDPERIKEIIFRGGIEKEIRAELWKFLLGYDCWDHTNEEREQRRQNLLDEYYRMKTQWTSMSTNQEKNHSGYRDRKGQIEKDVKRTDRNLDFYNGDNNPNIETLQSILLTFVMYNFNIGYVQGMSDLLSPILFLMGDEAVSFWCFVGFMEKVFRNFDEDQAGMKNQLAKLRTLMEYANPKLFNYLKKSDSDNMFFCFRWLLVWFKREFTHDDILELWEIFYSSMPCDNFHLLFGIAILDNEMDTIISNDLGFTEILKHVNDLSEKINLNRTLETAEAIYYQIITSSKIPDRVRVAIGMKQIKQFGDSPYDTDDEEEVQLEIEKKEREMEQILEDKCDSDLQQNFF